MQYFGILVWSSAIYMRFITFQASAEQEIHRLKKRCMILESASNTSMKISGHEKVIESAAELNLNLNESILIVGGHDGVSWSSALDVFLPSHDVLRSLKPMSSDRSYASVARFNGELYVFGGGCGSKWYDSGILYWLLLSVPVSVCPSLSLSLYELNHVSHLCVVESYNVVNNEWNQRPSLNKEKGSLAGAALNGKIFALGGGNGVECFSDVEMFDLHVGRWISARSMLEKVITIAYI